MNVRQLKEKLSKIEDEEIEVTVMSFGRIDFYEDYPIEDIITSPELKNDPPKIVRIKI